MQVPHYISLRNGHSSVSTSRQGRNHRFLAIKTYRCISLYSLPSRFIAILIRLPLVKDMYLFVAYMRRDDRQAPHNDTLLS